MIQTEEKILKRQKQKNKSFNQQRILQDVFEHLPQDISLINNPFLKDQEKFKLLSNKLKQYNKALANFAVSDSYQAIVYQRLFSLLSTLCNLLTKDLQIDRLNQIYEWFGKQEKLIIQRKNQGIVRHKITKEFIQQMKGKSTTPQFKKQTGLAKMDYKNMIPSQISGLRNLPYIKKWRTTHKQLSTPDIRLSEYNRKNINFGILKYKNDKQAKKPPRITYPKVQKLKYIKQQEVQQGVQEGQKIQNGVTNPQNPQNIVNTQQKTQQKKQAQQPVVTPQVVIQQQQPAGQDLGLGEQPNDQPQQEQQQPQQNKLAPKLKSYVHQPRQSTKQQITSYQRMKQRYLSVQNDSLRKQRQDNQIVQIMNEWAVRKSKLDKQVTKRLQNMGINYNKFQHSYQQPEKQEYFSEKDLKKYGLSKTFELKTKKPDIDLTLPLISNKSQMYEKTIRKDKLNILKKKFGHLLDLKEYQQRQVSQSMCQIQSQRKGFSDLLKRHSKSKQRLKQLDEVVGLKQKLARNKISVDITALSSSLCIPEDEQRLPEGQMPSKNLLSNPFWVQTTKKKKKK